MTHFPSDFLCVSSSVGWAQSSFGLPSFQSSKYWEGNEQGGKRRTGATPLGGSSTHSPERLLCTGLPAQQTETKTHPRNQLKPRRPWASGCSMSRARVARGPAGAALKLDSSPHLQRLLPLRALGHLVRLERTLEPAAPWTALDKTKPQLPVTGRLLQDPPWPRDLASSPCLGLLPRSWQPSARQGAVSSLPRHQPTTPPLPNTHTHRPGLSSDNTPGAQDPGPTVTSWPAFPHPCLDPGF